MPTLFSTGRRSREASRHVVGVIVALSALDTAQGSSEGTPRAVPTASFTFDEGFDQRGGLGFAFDRTSTTLDFQGLPIMSDQPRFAAPQHIPTPPVLEVMRTTSSFTSLFASGVDEDGQTSLLVLFEDPPGINGLIDVYRGDPENFAQATVGNGINRTQLGDRQDILQGAIPNRAYSPRSGVICHGMIILQCEVSRFRIPPNLSGVWEPLSVAYVVSTDDGATWTLVHEDFPSNINVKRSRDWSFQNWFPLDNSGAMPLEAWFVAADYRSIRSSVGGVLHLFRMTRPAVGAAWTLEPVETVFSLPFEQGRKQHTHSGGVVRFGEEGLRVIGAVGDNRDDNAIVSVTRTDENYTDASGWTIDDAYHGARDPGGTYANQFVGCAPSADLRELLVGTDLSGEQIMLLRSDDDAPHPETSWVFGRNTANQLAGLNFVLRTPTPELGGPYTVEWSVNPSMSTPINASRALYSPDGERWAIAVDPQRSTLFPAIAGDRLILASRSDSGGVVSTPLPTLRTRRPLSIAPGGVQHIAAAPTIVPGDGGSLVALAKDAQGRWVDNDTPLDPQPPASGPVFRVTGTDSLADRWIGDLVIGGAGDIGSATGVDRLRWRSWILSASPGQSVIVTTRLVAPNNALVRNIETNINTTRDWWPIEGLADIPIDEGESARVRLEYGSLTPAAPSFYLALDTLTEGSGWPGYPLPHDQTGTGTAFPDERATITGLAVDTEWTVSLAGMVPDHAWDSSVTTASSRWPLAAVWADADNYIEVIADIAEDTLRIETTRAGQPAVSLQSPSVYWLRNSPVLISISHNAAGISASASVSGQEVAELQLTDDSPANVPLAAAPIEIRLGDASGLSSAGQQVRVSPMWWFGGAVHDQSLDAAQRKTVLTELAFLDPATCAADLTTDGTADGVSDGLVTLSDFSFYLTLWSGSDARADVTSTGSANGIPDGSVDLSDFSYYLTLWSAGCP